MEVVHGASLVEIHLQIKTMATIHISPSNDSCRGNVVAHYCVFTPQKRTKQANTIAAHVTAESRPHRATHSGTTYDSSSTFKAL